MLSHGNQVALEAGLESPELPGEEFSILKLFFSHDTDAYKVEICNAMQFGVALGKLLMSVI